MNETNVLLEILGNVATRELNTLLLNIFVCYFFGFNECTGGFSSDGSHLILIT